MKLVALLLACACSKPADKPVKLTAIADITGEATLVAGTRRVAVYGGETWWQSDAGGLPIGATIAQERARLGGLVDIFLGATPILVGGEEHHEEHLRITSSVTPIDFDVEVSKIVTLRNGREAWLARVGIVDQIVFVTGTNVEITPKLPLVGPPADTVSPVSARLCATPKTEDIAVFGDEVYALVGECNEEAPLRIVAYPSGRVSMLPTRERLAMSFMKLAVSRDGKLHLVGIRDGHVHVENVLDDMVLKSSSVLTRFAATRVETALYADDGAFWTLVLDAYNKPQVLRDGMLVATPSPPKALALDDKFGVVVLTDKVLLAERPGARFVIETHR
jgi:hypothetical protein